MTLDGLPACTKDIMTVAAFATYEQLFSSWFSFIFLCILAISSSGNVPFFHLSAGSCISVSMYDREQYPPS